MGLLVRWLGRPESKSNALQSLIEAFSGVTSKAGQTVNVHSAFGVTTVLACARVKANGLAQVPCRLFQSLPDGSRKEVKSHPIHRLLYRRPNEFQTAFEFRKQIGLHLALCQNAYIVKVRDSRGQIIELLPYEPGNVKVCRAADMTLTYRLSLLGGRQVMIAADDMWHIRDDSWNGFEGMPTIELARDAIGLALAAQEYASEMFANGARPAGFLTTPSGLGAEKVAEIKEAFAANHNGSGNRFKTGLLSGGLAWVPVGQTADEAQMTEARKLQIVEICRAMGVMPIMVGHQDGTAAYASVEQMFLAHVTHTLAPLFEMFEQSAEINLLTDREQADGYYIELVEAGLMRGTAKDRAETNAIKKQNGVITANEWRDDDDWARHPDPAADQLLPATNLYGPPSVPAIGG